MVPSSSRGTPRWCPPGLPGHSARPPCLPSARRGARCPAAARAAAGSGPRAAGAHIRGRRRSPARPLRARRAALHAGFALATLRARRRPPPSPARPGLPPAAPHPSCRPAAHTPPGLHGARLGCRHPRPGAADRGLSALQPPAAGLTPSAPRPFPEPGRWGPVPAGGGADAPSSARLPRRKAAGAPGVRRPSSGGPSSWHTWGRPRPPGGDPGAGRRSPLRHQSSRFAGSA